MNYLIRYESFEVVMGKSTNEIISSYGLTMDDIEDLFLEFSDLGFRIRIMPVSGVGPYGIDKNAGFFVDVVGNFAESKKNSIDPYSPEISLMIKRIIRNSTRLGLHLAESPRRVITSRVGGEWSGFIRFTLKKTMMDLEEDRKTHKILKESVFSDIPEPEIMTDDEYYEEVNNGKEENFNQKEKELFISLSDTIPLGHKLYRPEFLDTQINFSLTNGDEGIYPELKSTTVLKSITTYKNEDEFYYVNVWDRDDSVTMSYRCDGYECWEKFIKEIFQGYRDLINQKGNKSIKESVFGGIPDPELMTVDEWDDEVTNAEEVDFNQKEKELFIALSDTIPLKHKINTPEISNSYLCFTLANGYGGIYPELRGLFVVRTVTSYKCDDEYYYIAKWDMGSSGEKLYRCDGYQCWEKFLKEIFQGYRDLTNK